MKVKVLVAKWQAACRSKQQPPEFVACASKQMRGATWLALSLLRQLSSIMALL